MRFYRFRKRLFDYEVDDTKIDPPLVNPKDRPLSEPNSSIHAIEAHPRFDQID
jgi:hypothetical protein